jgi:hypothetical protein
LVVRVLLTTPAEAAASQKWKIIYLQVLRFQLAANNECGYFNFKFEFDFRKKALKAEKPIKRGVEEFNYLPELYCYFIDFSFVICYKIKLRANPCGARIRSRCLKEPIPVLREIRS